MSEVDDPFTQGNRAVLAALNACLDLVGGETPLVAIRNRLAVVRNPMGAIEVPADTAFDPTVDAPELLVTQNGFEMPLRTNSREVRARQGYAIQVIESQRTVERLNLIKWHCTRAVARAAIAAPPFGLPFCDSVEVTDTQEGRPGADPGQPRPNGEWLAVFTVWLSFYFDARTVLF